MPLNGSEQEYQYTPEEMRERVDYLHDVRLHREAGMLNQGARAKEIIAAVTETCKLLRLKNDGIKDTDVPLAYDLNTQLWKIENALESGEVPEDLQ